MTCADASPRSLLFSTAWPLAMGLLISYAGVATVFVRLGAINPDEGFYLADGLVPYLDFGYTQPPFLLYWHGAILRMVGWGILELRVLNALWGGGCVVMMFVLLRRAQVAPAIILLCVAAWIASPAAVYFTIVGKTYAFAGFALLMSALALIADAKPRTRLVWLSLWASAAVGTRLAIAPAALLLWIGLVLQLKGRLRWPAALGVPAFCAFLMFGPFFYLAPDRAYFWLWGYHMKFTSEGGAAGGLWESALLAPAVSGIVVAAVVAWLARRMFEPAFWWLAAALAGWALNVCASGIYGEYAVPFWPLAVVGAGAIVGRWIAGQRWHVTLAVMGVAALSIVGYSKSSVGAYMSWLKPGYLPAIQQAAHVVAAHSAPNDWVVSSMPEVTIAARRAVSPRLVMGKFGATGEMPREDADRLGLMTFDELVGALSARRPSVVVLSHGDRWSFGWSAPSLRSYSKATYRHITGALQANYRLVHSSADFRVWTRRSDREGESTPSGVLLPLKETQL